MPRVRAGLPAGVPLGVLTFDASAFAGAFPILAADDGVVVEGLAPGCHFRRVVEGDLERDDAARLAADVADAARRLAARHPGAVVLECANLAPWRALVERACGIRAFDLVDAVLEAT